MIVFWDEDEAAQVEGLLTQFNGASEVCAVMGCQEKDLDALCKQAFNLTFEQTREHFAAQGRALVRRALMSEAMGGNMKAIDMLAREYLGMSPSDNKQNRKGTETTVRVTPLEVIRGRKAG